MQIIEHLTRPEFEHVDEPSRADICWIYHSAIGDNFRQVRRGVEAHTHRHPICFCLWTMDDLEAHACLFLCVCWLMQEHNAKADAIMGQSPGDECLVFKHLLPGTAARAPHSWQWIPQVRPQECVCFLSYAHTH